jgi:hypothetical protein
MSLDFNDQSEKPRFIYKRNPLTQHDFQIFELKTGKNDYEPVGEYTLIDLSEAVELTEKKLMNLMVLMNGKRKLLDLSNLTNTRILFNIIPGTPDDTKEKVVFRTYDGTGVSKDNAVLTIEKGVFNDNQQKQQSG